MGMTDGWGCAKCYMYGALSVLVVLFVLWMTLTKDEISREAEE